MILFSRPTAPGYVRALTTAFYKTVLKMIYKLLFFFIKKEEKPLANAPPPALEAEQDPSQHRTAGLVQGEQRSLQQQSPRDENSQSKRRFHANSCCYLQFLGRKRNLCIALLSELSLHRYS